MKAFLLILLLAFPTAAAAQSGGDDDGRDLMIDALRLFMRGLMAEIEPALDDLSELMESFDMYHPPEVLPNGDIIIRRKTPAEIESEEGGEIEL